MRDVSVLAAEVVQQAQAGGTDAVLAGPVVRKLFVLLQGSYGTLFVSKFATGLKDDKGRDKGIRAAMLLWDARLARFPAEVVEAAAMRLTGEHPKFPPNLPEFEALCEAAMPRQTYAQLQGLPLLPAPQSMPVHVELVPHGDGKDWARRVLARVKQGDRTVKRFSLKAACEALGEEALA